MFKHSNDDNKEIICIRNAWRTVRRICIFISRIKGIKKGIQGWKSRLQFAKFNVVTEFPEIRNCDRDGTLSFEAIICLLCSNSPFLKLLEVFFLFFNPLTYKQSHTPTAPWYKGGGGLMAPPWVFVMLQYFEKIPH